MFEVGVDGLLVIDLVLEGLEGDDENIGVLQHFKGSFPRNVLWLLLGVNLNSVEKSSQ